MKTVLEWLEWAKEQGYEWADAAIRNYDPAYKRDDGCDNLYEAVQKAFKWVSSPEGHSFWINIYRTVASQATTSFTDLAARYDAARLGLAKVLPDPNFKEPYRTQIYEATKASYEEQLAEVKSEIAKKLGIEPIKERKLIGWVVQSEDGGYSKTTSPDFIKDNGEWLKFWGAGWSDITTEQVAALCDRLPQWSDNEPTPIYQ